MAIQMSYIDQYGKLYPQAYFRVVQINLNFESKTGYITFNCYEDSAGKGKRVINSKSYTVTPVVFDSYFHVTPTDTTTASNASLCMAYKLAKETKDKDSGGKDSGGNPIMVSFFNGGVDV